MATGIVADNHMNQYDCSVDARKSFESMIEGKFRLLPLFKMSKGISDCKNL
jgi:hypothetical protein